MSFAEDESFDGFDPTDLDEYANDTLVWVTNTRDIIPVIELTDLHLARVIRRIQSGGSVGEQSHKLPYLVREQKLRTLRGEQS
jgi:hypothetical protein